MRILNSFWSHFQDVSSSRFYKGGQVAKLDWWFSWCHEYPDLYFARLRTFSNGKADVLFQDENIAYGFDNEDSAGHFISEDEFSRLACIDENDKKFIKVPNDVIIEPPSWGSKEAFEFKYIGKY